MPRIFQNSDEYNNDFFNDIAIRQRLGSIFRRLDELADSDPELYEKIVDDFSSLVFKYFLVLLSVTIGISILLHCLLPNQPDNQNHQHQP